MVTCSGGKCERCTAPVAFQRVDGDFVSGTWLQT